MSATADAGRVRRRVATPMGLLAVTAGRDGLSGVTWEKAAEAGESADAAGSRSGSRSGSASARPALPAERTAEAAVRQLGEYLRGERRSFDLVLDLEELTMFRRRVLEELTRIPRGETVSYGELAERSGRPGAARAVGNAVARNPVPVVLPCHRVIRSDGSTGRYGGGRERKRKLLRLEGALQRPDAPPGPSVESPG